LRQAVGAHYGWRGWLVQRVTAVVVVAYTLVLLGLTIAHGGWDYATYAALFAGPAFRLATLLFVAAMCWHAWVGMRDIWMDYIKPVGLRLTLEALTVIALIGYVAWAAQIFWSRA